MRKYYSFLAALLFFFSGSQLFGQTTIVTDTVLPTSTCPGAFMLVPFQVNNPTFNPGNVFYAEWSNAFGSFANPDTIGSIPFIFGGQGVIFASIPQDAGFGLLYRVRVVSSNPEVIGSQCPIPIFVTAINFTANISADPSDPQCEGDEVTLTAGLGIGLGATYQWSNGSTDPTAVVTQPGQYSVTVTSLGCDVASPPFNLDMLPVPAQPTISKLPNGDLQSSQESGYQWFLDGSPIPNATSQTISPGQPGQYSVAVISSDGCLSAASLPFLWAKSDGTIAGNQYEPFRDTVVSWIPFNLNQDTTTIDTTEPPVPTFTDYSIRVFPNPSHDYLIVETNTLRAEKISFILYDMDGRTMFTSPRQDVLGHYKYELDVSQFPAGFYNMQLFVRGHLRSLMIQKR